MSGDVREAVKLEIKLIFEILNNKKIFMKTSRLVCLKTL